MSRRVTVGFGTGDKSWATREVIQATRWTIAVDTTAKRKGAYGLHVARVTGAGSGVGAYEELDNSGSGATNNVRSVAQGNVDTTMPYFGTDAGEPRRVWARVYHKPVAMASFNTFTLLSLRDASDTEVAGMRLETASPQRYRVAATGNAIGSQHVTPTVGNWYRLEIMLEQLPGQETIVMGWVYAEDGTLLSINGTTINAASWTASDIFRVEVGYRVITQASSVHEGYFADLAVNDSNTPSTTSGIHNMSPGPGACRNFLMPDAAGDSAQLVGVGDTVNTYNNVNEWPPNDDTDYNITAAAATTPKDAFNLPALTIPGSQVVKAIGTYIRASDALGGFSYYKLGVRSGGVDLEGNCNQTGGYFYRMCSIGEDNGAAWGNTAAGNAQSMFRKTTADATAQMKYSSIALEYEDNDAIAEPVTATAWHNDKPIGGSEA